MSRPLTPPSDVVRGHARVLRETFEESRDALTALANPRTPIQTNLDFRRLLDALACLQLAIMGIELEYDLPVQRATHPESDLEVLVPDILAVEFEEDEATP